jgi:hypothetical protein
MLWVIAFIIYYAIGVMYYIFYTDMAYDALDAVLIPFVWPVLIFMHIYRKLEDRILNANRKIDNKQLIEKLIESGEYVFNYNKDYIENYTHRMYLYRDNTAIINCMNLDRDNTELFLEFDKCKQQYNKGAKNDIKRSNH